MVIVGIDPGLTGALAFIGPNSVAVADIPTVALTTGGMVKRRVDGLGLAYLIRKHCPAGEPVLVVCEAVQAMGGKDNAMQTQAALVGCLRAIEAVLDVLRLKAHMVRPQEWQGLYGLQGKRKEVRERGQHPEALVKARTLYPGAAHDLARVKDHNRGEALLVAHFGKVRLA